MTEDTPYIGSSDTCLSHWGGLSSALSIYLCVHKCRVPLKRTPIYDRRSYVGWKLHKTVGQVGTTYGRGPRWNPWSVLLLLLPFILAPIYLPTIGTIQIMQCTYYNTRLRPFFCSAFLDERISLHLREVAMKKRLRCIGIVRLIHRPSIFTFSHPNVYERCQEFNLLILLWLHLHEKRFPLLLIYRRSKMIIT